MFDNLTQDIKEANKELENSIRKYGKNDIQVAYIYLKLANFYLPLDEHKKILDYSFKAIDILKLYNSNEVIVIYNLVSAYSNIGSSYLRLKEYQKSKDYITISIKFSEYIDDIYSNDYYMMASLYSELNEIKKSLEYSKKDLKRIERREYRQEDIMQNYLNQILCYKSLFEFDEAKKYALKIEDSLKINKLDYHLYPVYQHLADIESLISNENSYNYRKKAFNLYKRHQQDSFELLDTQNKHIKAESSFDVMGSLIIATYEYLQILAQINQTTQPKLIEILQTTVNDVINYKGEISNLNNILSIIEAKTDNKEIKINIQNLKNLKIELSNEYQKFENNNQISQINNQISDIEINLSANNKEFKEFLAIKEIRYQDISSNLTPNQLYMDFILLTNKYCLFTIDFNNNITFRLLDDYLNIRIEEFRYNIENNIRDNNRILKDIFDILTQSIDSIKLTTLSNELKNKTELIISPDGLLNLLPFEALYDGEKYLIETKTISYISSAKEFVRGLKREKVNNKNDIVAFGDANFDMKFDSGSRGVPLLLKEEFSNLPATKNEIEAISKIYPNAKIYTNDKASVENLLNIKNPKILHLATHGFYLKDEDTHPLEKSGLAFSGASRASKVGDTRGIITALKISTMDLNDTDLVVLSACESGLGDINSSDGVMNLSSAFIQAGAKSVIISLWKINDEATSILIQDFYDNISKGKSYKEALREAKLKMIDKNPFYWSSLIISGV